MSHFKNGKLNQTEGSKLVRAIINKINAWDQNCKIGGHDNEDIADLLINEL